MTTIIRKSFRIDEETNRKFKELLSIYNVKSENELFRAVVSDIHELKKNKALVPFSAYEQEKKQLQQAIYEIGKLKGALEEKEKQIEELKQSQQDKKKGFWTRLFGLDG